MTILITVNPFVEWHKLRVTHNIIAPLLGVLFFMKIAQKMQYIL